jgi:predicted dehydrogenase
MTTYNRRQFLEDSLLAAAVAAAFPAQHLVAADETIVLPKKNPGDLLQAAIIGTGTRGCVHIDEYLRNPNTEIAYIVDVDEAIGQKRAEYVGKRQRRVPKVVQDMRHVFDDKSVHLVSIATPNHWHALAAIWAMQAGKDVYVEKPVSHNVSEGRRLVETARKYNRICQAGTQCRSMQGTIDAIKYVQSGKIGEVKLARGLCYKRRKSIGPKGHYEVPASVDYNLWCGPSHTLPVTRKQFHYDWHWQREWGNGDMGNQGPHQMDIARWGLGIDRLPDRVVAYGGRLGYEDAGDVANTEVGLFECGDKSLVFEVRGLETDDLRGSKIGVIFYGSEGCIVMTSYTAGAAFDLSGKLIEKFEGVGGGDAGKEGAYDPSGQLVVKFNDEGRHFDNFIDAVKSRDYKQLRADVLEGHISCAYSHLANMSYYLGKPTSVDDIRKTLGAWKTREDTTDCLNRTIQHLAANDVDLNQTPLSLGPVLNIDVEHETVLDNAEANKLLTREYRAPFLVPKAGEV